MSVDIASGAIEAMPVTLKHDQGTESKMNQDSSESISSINRSQNTYIEGDTKIKPEASLSLLEKEAQAEAPVINAHQLENVAKQLQEFMGKMNRGLEFLVDEDSGRDVIKVVDKSSGELIKQYPSEEVLTLVSKLSAATGNLVDSKV